MYLFAILFLFSCSDYLIKSHESTGPELVVHPEIIDFGHLMSGQETGQASFAIINAGDEDLIISNPILALENERYSMDETLEESYVIPPGETQEFNVYYQPETYENNENISYTFRNVRYILLKSKLS